MADGLQIIADGDTPSGTKLSKIGRRVIIDCTTAGRPSSPLEAMHIWDLDFDMPFYYTGSAWVMLPGRRCGCRVKRSALQSIANNSWTDVSWDTESGSDASGTYEDTDGFISTTSTTITIPTGFGGLYSLSAFFYLSSTNSNNTTGQISVQVNGSDAGIDAPLPTYANRANLAVTMPFADGDDLVMRAIQFSGAGLDMTARLNLYRVGP